MAESREVSAKGIRVPQFAEFFTLVSSFPSVSIGYSINVNSTLS
jgi:hypothetical protein